MKKKMKIEQTITKSDELLNIIAKHPELKSNSHLADCDLISVEKDNNSEERPFMVIDKRNFSVLECKNLYLISQMTTDGIKYTLDYNVEAYKLEI
jgi:hypothetical protein